MSTLVLPADVVVALDNQTIAASGNNQVQLTFNRPVKQVQVALTVGTSTSCNVQLYGTLDFVNDYFITDVSTGIGSTLTYVVPTGSLTNFLLKSNNYDAGHTMSVTGISVLGVSD